MNESLVFDRAMLTELIAAVARGGNRGSYYPNPDDDGDPNNPFGPYGPGGPVINPAVFAARKYASALAARAVHAAVMVQEIARALPEGQLRKQFGGAGLGMILAFDDEFICGTGWPHRWPFPPRPHGISDVITPGDAFAAAGVMLNAAVTLGKGELHDALGKTAIGLINNALQAG
jgi:hypothetical protein